MTVVTELRSMMLTSVTRTVRNRRIVTLLRSVEKEEDCINVASGKTMIDKDKMEEYFVGFLSGETTLFAMSADFAVLCQSAPTRMELISEILQTNLCMD